MCPLFPVKTIKLFLFVFHDFSLQTMLVKSIGAHLCILSFLQISSLLGEIFFFTVVL
mgnify:CR=1 FL=1